MKPCPECQNELITVRTPTITSEMALEAAGDRASDETILDEQVRAHNEIATNFDSAVCTVCGWTGYVRNTDVAIRLGSYRMRVTEYKCQDCGGSFDSLDELSEHFVSKH